MTLILRDKPLPYLVAKFQQTSALLELEELRSLFAFIEQELGRVYLYSVGTVLEESAVQFSLDNFLNQYRDYLAALKEGREIEQNFSLALTLDPNTLYTIVVGEGQRIVKFLLPSLHLTSNSISYLAELHSFKEKLYGKNVIPWGVHISYPQLFQDATTQVIHNALQEFGNARLFKVVQRWMRMYTKHTFFFTERGEVKTTIRLGRECASWINTHPKLQMAQIRVDKL